MRHLSITIPSLAWGSEPTGNHGGWGALVNTQCPEGREICEGGSWWQEDGGDRGWHLARGFYWQKVKKARNAPPIHIGLLASVPAIKIKAGSKGWGSGSPLGTVLSPHTQTFVMSEDIFGGLNWWVATGIC